MPRIFSEKYTCYIYRFTDLDKIDVKCFILEIFSTRQEDTDISLGWQVAKRLANHNVAGNRLNTEYLRKGSTDASKPGMPGWVHPAEVVRATSSSNQLPHLKQKQGVNDDSEMTLEGLPCFLFHQTGRGW